MAIHWPTTLVEAGQRRGCTIVDVSRSGARIMLGEPIAPMTCVTLFDERVGTIEATVVWCRGEMAGLAFHALAPAVVEKLRGLLLAIEGRGTDGTGAPASPIRPPHASRQRRPQIGGGRR